MNDNKNTTGSFRLLLLAPKTADIYIFYNKKELGLPRSFLGQGALLNRWALAEPRFLHSVVPFIGFIAALGSPFFSARRGHTPREWVGFFVWLHAVCLLKIQVRHVRRNFPSEARVCASILHNICLRRRALQTSFKESKPNCCGCTSLNWNLIHWWHRGDQAPLDSLPMSANLPQNTVPVTGTMQCNLKALSS